MYHDLCQALRRKAGQDQGRVREDMLAKELAKDVERKKRGEFASYATGV